VSAPRQRLTVKEVERYRVEGFVQPVAIIDFHDAVRLRHAAAEHIAGLVPTERYELTDEVKVRRIEAGDGTVTYEYVDEQPTEPHTLPFLFNIWRLDPRFRAIALDPRIGFMAKQLLGCEEVLLMEDNVVAKAPGAGVVPWHQDLSYWPIEDPAVVTVWIALDDIHAANGAMTVVPGSHRTVEHLPVQFRDAATFMAEHRPGVPTLTQDPGSAGHPVVVYRTRAGEGGFHHPLLWHGSTPNGSGAMRSAYVLRYIAAGTAWLGSSRVPYDDLGCVTGAPVTSDHLPRVPTDP
jgi:hypothetical protein